ncbi:MAG: N-formylglutamate deformylase [Woeseia sp.]
MTDSIYDFHYGSSPLLISVPHDGRLLPDDVATRMTPVALALPDTDWHVASLYEFARELGASIITARYSRYVVDLNRPPDDSALYDGQVSTGTCPSRTFAGEAIYKDGNGVSEAERQARVDHYWRPYHAQIATALDESRMKHGYALLWDAHSIASEVPGLFDGRLPVLNLGTNKGASCAAEIAGALESGATNSVYPAVSNARFTGGHITRHFGRPRDKVHAVQLELAQRSYMDEKTLRYDPEASKDLQQVLHGLLETFLHSAEEFHA